MRLFLIGFMGSGKSYVGRRLAERLAFGFLDLDELIVEKAEKSIPEIFAEEGEVAFRTLEKDCLRSLANRDRLLVACGGGTPCFFDNMDWMNANGLTIFLETSVQVLAKRLLPEMAQRPLLADQSKEELEVYLEEKLSERMPFYGEAQIVYRQEHGNEPVVEELANFLLQKKGDE